jgi:hypothetical protein
VSCLHSQTLKNQSRQMTILSLLLSKFFLNSKNIELLSIRIYMSVAEVAQLDCQA